MTDEPGALFPYPDTVIGQAQAKQPQINEFARFGWDDKSVAAYKADMAAEESHREREDRLDRDMTGLQRTARLMLEGAIMDAGRAEQLVGTMTAADCAMLADDLRALHHGLCKLVYAIRMRHGMSGMWEALPFIRRGDVADFRARMSRVPQGATKGEHDRIVGVVNAA